MSKKKDKPEHTTDQKGKYGPDGLKLKCCEKFKKKGRHCSRCPIAATCRIPD